ncbi:MAG: hypothetical protein CL996_04105 [Euryarchaeota archaeon]|nr:hypothetical protein [Euryarchaeota archaeon]
MVTGHFQEFEDEYLEAFYEFHERKPGQRVRNGDIAKYLNVSPASATEMVQRLAKNGFLDYAPYKGAMLTETGLEHGMMMKRRHRLAEVLLSRLPFDGDVHETACRLEHAFNDDLELCISKFLGNPTVDPSGRNIPPANDRISSKLEATGDMKFLSDVEDDSSGEFEIIVLTQEEKELLSTLGIESGNHFIKTNGDTMVNGQIIDISRELASKIVVRVQH